MSEPKDAMSLLRKMAKFVAHPATDWKDIAGAQAEGAELDRNERKAMLERRKRNDFVRKREFDTLRRLRRANLTPEQLQRIGVSSPSDSELLRSTADPGNSVRSELALREKIDEIEQAMVGDATRPRAAPSAAPPASASDPNARTTPTPRPRPRAAASGPPPVAAPAPAPTSASASAPATPPRPAPARPAGPVHQAGPTMPMMLDDAPIDVPPVRAATGARTGEAAPPAPGGLPPLDLALPFELPPLPPLPSAATPRPSPPAVAARPRLDLVDAVSDADAVNVSEVVHDADLDEAVIAFANADIDHCEKSLVALCRRGGLRHDHAETWAVLFDLYRATDQAAKFEALAGDYVERFGRSAPQWSSLPRLAAERAAERAAESVTRTSSDMPAGPVGAAPNWSSPPRLESDAVEALRRATMDSPQPWLVDWGALVDIDSGGASAMCQLFDHWSREPLSMRWLGTERLLTVLADATPAGLRSTPPQLWLARLAALRLLHRPDRFDEAAIDYCVTYEVSPPSYERARCSVRPVGAGAGATGPASGPYTAPDVTATSSRSLDAEYSMFPIATVELAGQVLGDVSKLLQQLDRRIGAKRIVTVDCHRLIRVDFIAAGDLLNWVLSKGQEDRQVTFQNAHRLVALFFGAMGISEHARVQVPRT